MQFLNASARSSITTFSLIDTQYTHTNAKLRIVTLSRKMDEFSTLEAYFDTTISYMSKMFMKLTQIILKT